MFYGCTFDEIVENYVLAPEMCWQILNPSSTLVCDLLPKRFGIMSICNHEW